MCGLIEMHNADIKLVTMVLSSKKACKAKTKVLTKAESKYSVPLIIMKSTCSIIIITIVCVIVRMHGIILLLPMVCVVLYQ